jgi:hypothetical protein
MNFTTNFIIHILTKLLYALKQYDTVADWDGVIKKCTNAIAGDAGHPSQVESLAGYSNRSGI